MKSYLRIVMLIGRFYPVQGGAEIQCLRLSEQLKKTNNKILILTQALPGLKSKENIENIAVYRIGLPLKGKFGSFSYMVAGFIWFCFNKNKFDVLHAHLASSPAILTGIISKIFKKPSLLKFGGSRSTGDIATSGSTRFGKIKLVFLRKTISKFICPSKEIYDEIERAGFPKRNIQIIPNGVDTDIFSPSTVEEKIKLRKDLFLPEQSIIFIYTGRLVKGKGLDILLDAWKKISNELDNGKFCLIILGSGLIEEDLKREYGFLKSVIFCGWKDNVVEYLKASDVFILPSFGEGVPNSLIEAMSCGLICVATNIGGIIELIKNNINGLLLSAGNVEELYKAIKNLLINQNSLNILGSEARKFVKQNLAIETVAEKYQNIYNTILNNN